MQRLASQTFRIPSDTIIDNIKSMRGSKSNSYGRPTALNTDIETKMVEGLRCMERYDFGLLRKEVMSLLLEKKITDLGLENKPHVIFNCDETSFCRDPSKTKVVGTISYASTRTTSISGKEIVTVLLTINASDDKVLPLIKGENIWNQWSAPEGTGDPGTSYTATSNGWMEAETAAPNDLPAVPSMLTSERTFEHLGSSQPINDVAEVIASSSATTKETSPAIKDFSGEKEKKMRIATESEVITPNEVSHRVQNIQNEKKIAEEQKNKRKKQTESKKKEAKSKKSRKRIVNETPDILENDAFSLRSSGSEDLANCFEREIREFEDVETAFKDVSEMQTDAWVIVEFCTKRTTKHFVRQISSLIVVIQFPQVEDKSSVDRADVVSILPSPTIGRRGYLTFQVAFVQCNIN
ncbi:hypothetical protein ILUMI_04590 [Ignelater luminosus]|uniref:Uncharacterized protein n=1 Tax=Ignelater luminosus TaxID=2038154 RepID=A0A8K0DE60_IGNLU|nr:hypothetical protein ILUMI_04590 [Ignelater luminosus]